MPRTARRTRRKHPHALSHAPRRRPRREEFAPIEPINLSGQLLDGPALRRLVFDEMERLREVRGLSALLERYETLGKPDRLVWQDRVTDLVGLSNREMVRLHGELLAYGWIEQNTGVTGAAPIGAAALCYRITHAGLRALKQLHAEEVAAR